MLVSAGTKLGPYEIVSMIGAGGMGEVYRARDPRLGREVAIKILPAQFVSDADRLRRFDQEARAAGMLNHPNIVSIYDIGTEEGTVYVVSELLSGETLRERLGGSALPARKAVEIALQIAHGLAAAHEKGIVHRDLKPENIFLTKDGRAKILDFGLAKLVVPQAQAAEQSRMQTAEPGTQPGMVLGTVGYMSPEQVRGRETDHRSDIFSFGAILYEMLTGKHAFRRDSTADTMSAILKEDPPDASSIASGMPPSLERILRHCLEKNPEQRFQSARDLAFDLEMISGVSGTASVQARPAPEHRNIAGKAAIALLLLAFAAAGFLAGRKTHPTAAAAKTGTASAFEYQRLTFRRGFVSSARFTPDGQSVVYSAAWLGGQDELFVTRPQSLVSRALGVTDADILSISRNGEMAVLLAPRFTVGWQKLGTLARAPIDGGAPREILRNVQDADWSPDGKQLAVSRQVDGRYRLEYPIGKELYKTEGWLNCVKVSPDGTRVAFMEHQQPGDDRGYVSVVDGAGKVEQITEEFASESGLAWSPDGKEIWFTASPSGSNEQPVYAVTMQKEQRMVTTMVGNLILHDLNSKGKVLLTWDSRRREMMALPPGETKERDLSWFDWSYPRYISDDGKTVVFEEQGSGGGPNYSVFIRKMDGSPAVKLGDGFCGDLSPDGNFVASRMPSDLTRYILLPTGAGEAKNITSPGLIFDSGVAHWFQDGKRMLFSAYKKGEKNRLWVIEIATGKATPVTPQGFVGAALISRDQSSVLAQTEEGFAFFPVDGGAPTRVPALQNGDALRQWTEDGKGVYVQELRSSPTKITLVDLVHGQRTPWKEIAPTDTTGIVSLIDVLITPDGKSYVYTFRRALSELYMISGLQ